MFSSFSGNLSGVTNWISESSKQAADAVQKGVTDLNSGITGMMKEEDKEKSQENKSSDKPIEDQPQAQQPSEAGESAAKESTEDKLKEVSAKLMSDVSSVWGQALAFGKTAIEKVEQNELVKQATVTVTDVAKKGAQYVENAPLIKDFNEEQKKFISENNTKVENKTPWSGYKNEDELKDQILQLSKDKRNFLRAPPAGALFEFDYKQSQPMALALLEVDSSLKDMRFQLVPKVSKEEDFWRNYFYRVSLLKQNAEPIEDEEPVAEVQSDDKNNLSAEEDELNLDEEFASEEVGTKSDEIPQWEKELQDELQEYEVVEEEENGEWEKELEDMLGNESSPSDSAKPQPSGS
jgi:hypothetical protein